MTLHSSREPFRNPALRAIAIAATMLASASALAQEAGASRSIADQLTEQAQRIQVLERKLELQNEANQATTTSAAVPVKNASSATYTSSRVMRFSRTS